MRPLPVLALLSLAVLGLSNAGQDEDHYDPDAEKKVFLTTITWQVDRLEIFIDDSSLTMFDTDYGTG